MYASCTGVLNVHVQIDKKIVLLLARLQQGKFLSDRDSIRRGQFAADTAVGLVRQCKFRKHRLCGVINHRADGRVPRGIHDHPLGVFGDLIEHYRLSDAAAAIRQAQFDV